MSDQEPVSRRQRRRLETLREIRAQALKRLASHGAAGLSLNAIARDIGLTGPALYRYYASRDALLTDLIVGGYEDLGRAMQAATQDEGDLGAAIRALVRGYRSWALEQPARYQLIFGTPIPGYRDEPDRTLPAARRGLEVVALALARMAGGSVEDTLPVTIEAWARLHGLVSLELGGHLDTLPIEAEDLYQRLTRDLLAADELDPAGRRPAS